MRFIVEMTLQELEQLKNFNPSKVGEIKVSNRRGRWLAYRIESFGQYDTPSYSEPFEIVIV